MRDAPSRHLVDPARSPLADRRGDGFVVTESTRRVLALDRSRQRLLAEAALAGERVILLTGERTATTHAYDQLAEASGAAWVVRSRHGLRDARTGRRLERVEDVLSPAGEDAERAPEHARPPASETTRIDLACSLRHRNPARAEFGAALEAIADELLGLDDAELSWGAAEPALVPWDGEEVAEWVSGRIDRSPFLCISGVAGDGRRLAATLRAQLTSQGAEELLSVAVDAGPLDSEGARERLAAIPETLAALAEEGLPLFAMAHARYARADLLHGPTLEMPPVPMAMLIGAPGVARLGLDIPALAERHDAYAIGGPRRPGVVVGFGDDIRPTNFVDLSELLAELDGDRVGDALGEGGAAGLLGPEWRAAFGGGEAEEPVDEPVDAQADELPEDAIEPGEDTIEPDEDDSAVELTLPPPAEGWEAGHAS